MYNTLRVVLLAFIVPFFLLCIMPDTVTAQSTELTDAYWSDNDFILRFADSAAINTDLVASDSSELVIRVRGVTVSDSLISAIFTGPEERKAAMTRIGRNAVRLTVTAPMRFGNSTLWRPFSHTLWVHTFNWKGLEYAQEQYHKGLLALDQNLEKQAVEYLEVADSFGERRARSVLGIRFAQNGNDSAALEYLKVPISADDYAARAVVYNRMNDTASAAEADANYQRLLAENRIHPPTDTTSTDPALAENGTADKTDRGDSDTSDWSEITDWRSIGLIVLGLCLFVGLVIWLSSRSTGPKAPGTPPVEQHPAPPVSSDSTRPDTPVTARITPPIQPRETAPKVMDGDETEDAEKERPQEALHAPSVMSPPLVHSREKRSEEEKHEAEPTQPPPDASEEETASKLPKPDADPETTTPKKSEEAASATEKDTTEESLKTQHPVPPEQLSSVQGAALRKKMEDARQSKPDEASPENKDRQSPSEPSDTISEARRMKVSRGYVELRDRISQLREKLDDASDEDETGTR